MGTDISHWLSNDSPYRSIEETFAYHAGSSTRGNPHPTADATEYVSRSWGAERSRRHIHRGLSLCLRMRRIGKRRSRVAYYLVRLDAFEVIYLDSWSCADVPT